MTKTQQMQHLVNILQKELPLPSTEVTFHNKDYFSKHTLGDFVLGHSKARATHYPATNQVHISMCTRGTQVSDLAYTLLHEWGHASQWQNPEHQWEFEPASEALIEFDAYAYADRHLHIFKEALCN